MEFTDSKLDSYLAKVKESTTDSEILLNYKKAVRRLDMLKEQHNLLVKNLAEKSSDSSKDSESTETSAENSNSEDINSMSVDMLMNMLAELKTKIETESTDMAELTKLYGRYKRIVAILKTKQSEIQNKFNRVDSNRSGITVTKINLGSIC